MTSIPETDYGYWITDQGRFLIVSSAYGHVSIIEQYLETTDYDVAFARGWIRIVCSDALMIQYDPSKVSQKVIRELLRWSADVQNEYKLFVVSLKGGMGDFNESFKRTKIYMEIANFIRRSINNQINEAVIPETNYGYWITDKGDFIPVGYQDHWGVLVKQGLKPTGLSYDAGYNSGWVRIVSGKRNCEIALKTSRITKKAMVSLSKFLSSSPYEFVFVDIKSDRERNVEREYLSGTPQEAYRFIYSRYREAKKKNSPVTESIVPETNYGYWINADGEFIVVPFQSHSDVSNRYGFPRKFGAMEAGWIHIVAERNSTTEVMIDSERVSKVALKAFKSWMYECRGTSKFTIDDLDTTDGRYGAERDYVYDLDAIEAEKFIDKQIEIAYKKKREAARAERNKQPVTEGIVPETDYGYWITDDGDFIAVQNNDGHWNVLRRKFGDRSEYITAFRQGWIRIVCGDDCGLSAQYSAKEVSKKAIRALLRWAVEWNKEQEHPAFYVHVMYGTNFATAECSKFANFVRNSIARQNVDSTYPITESIIPDSSYGYWITNLGDYIVVPGGNTTHATILEQLPTPPHSYHDAFKHGWIRVVSNTKVLTLFVEIDTSAGIPTKEAMDALFALNSSIPFEEYRFANSSWKDGEKLDIKTNNEDRWIRYVRQAVKDAKAKDALKESKILRAYNALVRKARR